MRRLVKREVRGKYKVYSLVFDEYGVLDTVHEMTVEGTKQLTGADAAVRLFVLHQEKLYRGLPVKKLEYVRA